jgi:glycosyltransferase involved in cell wall biosynthesis
MSPVPLVSVIIPARNAERWIHDTISSVITQTWQNLEIIVVDDGSDDRTVDVVNSISDRRLRLISQSQRGAAAARNRGCVDAGGDFIQFLDADDLLNPEKLALQIAALRDQPPDSVASCAWATFATTPASAKIIPEPVWEIRDPTEWIVRSFTGDGMMQTASWLVPQNVAERAGPWNENLTLHDDGEYFTRILLHASRNIFVPGTQVYYRVVAASLSRVRNRKAIESSYEVCRSTQRELLAMRHDIAAKRAIATRYAQFAYEFNRDAPDLAGQAVAEIEKLRAVPAPIGGRSFRVLAGTLGFRRALRVRSALSR